MTIDGPAPGSPAARRSGDPRRDSAHGFCTQLLGWTPSSAPCTSVDHIVDHREIPDPVQRVLTEAVGSAGVVELVALCGLYALMGFMTTAFAIRPEPGLPALPPRRAATQR
jgi:hypothetical protein